MNAASLPVPVLLDFSTFFPVERDRLSAGEYAGVITTSDGDSSVVLADATGCLVELGEVETCTGAGVVVLLVLLGRRLVESVVVLVLRVDDLGCTVVMTGWVADFSGLWKEVESRTGCGVVVVVVVGVVVVVIGKVVVVVVGRRLVVVVVVVVVVGVVVVVVVVGVVVGVVVVVVVGVVVVVVLLGRRLVDGVALLVLR